VEDHVVNVTRRTFLKYCGASAASLGLSAAELARLEEALASTKGPTVVWLQGAACTGCSVSFLNRISTAEPRTAGSLLIDSVNLVYHPNLMALAGESAAAEAVKAYQTGGYVLAVEGAVPSAFGGATCWPWTYQGREATFQAVVTDMARNAAAVLSIGTCASFGGIPAAPPNPTGARGVFAATGRPTINVAGCPPHPDWIVWTISQLLLAKSIALDEARRPTAIYGSKIHDRCPRKGTGETKTIGVDGRCLKELGCQGPRTKANCQAVLWNGRMNWCIDANAPCHACTESTFPGTRSFYKTENLR